MTAARTRWLALARLSDQWRDDPLERQTVDLLEIVEREGGDLIEPVLVERVSGSQYRAATVKRPGWDRIIEAAAAGEIDGVAIYNIDRLTREPYYAELLIRAADAGLRVADPATTVDLRTGDGRQFFRGKVAAAAAESDAISRRVRRANEAKRQDGRPHWAARPFGFLIGDDLGQHHATEAAVLRDLYARFIGGETLMSLSDWLNGEGITQPERTDRATGEPIAKPWTYETVRALLAAERNAARYGSRTGYEARASWAPIVDDATFDAAQALLDTNAMRYGRSRAARGTHLLSGLLLCEHCGTRLTHGTGRKGYRYYVCKKDRSTGRAGCGTQISAALVEGPVRDAVLVVLADEAKRDEWLAPQEKADAGDLLATITYATQRQDELVALTRGRDALLTLGQIQPELRDLRNEAEQARAALARLDAISPARKIPAGDPVLALEAWDALTMPEQQATIVDVLAPLLVRKSGDGERVTIEPRDRQDAAA